MLLQWNTKASVEFTESKSKSIERQVKTSVTVLSSCLQLRKWYQK